MKNIILVFATIGLIACGETKEAEVKAPETFEEKAEAVCDCFEKASKGDKTGFMKCAKLQDTYHKTIEEERKQEFLQTTNVCMG